MRNGNWEFLDKGSAIGHKRIETLQGKMYSGIRLEITKSEGTPVIREMDCY